MKKNYRKIPKHIISKLKHLQAREIMVGCAISIPREKIAADVFKHLGISLQEGVLKFPSIVLPSPEQGKYSFKNINGETIVRRDLPKEHHTRTFDAPDWSGYGTHQVDIPYEAYPRYFVTPHEAKLSLHCENCGTNQEKYVFVVKVDEVIDIKKPDYADRLLYNINLLQENVGACDIGPADSSSAEYIKSLHVSWDILPPGNMEEVLSRLFHRRQPTREERDQAATRYAFFNSLNPQNIIIGSSGFSRYFGAQINAALVVFENIAYGNAVYVLFDNWKELSQRSRVDLLSGKFGDNFERIPHAKGWEIKVREIVSARR